MKGILFLLFVSLFLSCKEKNTSFYLEIGHKTGNKHFEMIHTDLDCSNINGLIYPIEPAPGVGFCSKCVSDSEIRKFNMLAESNHLTNKVQKAFEGLYELSRWYFSGDTLPKSNFIEVVMISHKDNIKRVYEYCQKNGGPKGNLHTSFEDAKYLLDMDLETFLIRVERYAESYLEDGEIFIWSEESEKEFDSNHIKWEKFKAENGLTLKK